MGQGREIIFLDPNEARTVISAAICSVGTESWALGRVRSELKSIMADSGVHGPFLTIGLFYKIRFMRWDRRSNLSSTKRNALLP